MGLQHRLALHVGLGLLFLSCLLGGLTYYLSFDRELAAAAALEKQLVQTVQAQAEIAVFARNRKIADEVIEGLRVNAMISVVDISGNDFPSPEIGALSLMPGSLFRTDYPLFSPVDGTHQIGSLVILRDAEWIADKARRTAKFQALIMLVQLVATVVLIAFTFRQLLSKPVANLASALGAIRPGSADRLSLPKGHASDEIGSLARSANGLLDVVDTSLRDLQTTNQKLSKALALVTEKEQTKSRFFAAANHDLRQPVHAINLFLDSLKRNGPRDDQLRHIVAIDHAVHSLNELLDSLLDISKLDAGAILPKMEWVPVADLFEHLDNNFSSLALQRTLRFKYWFPGQALEIHTDRQLLLTLLSNLVGNALKYTAKGSVLISLRRRYRPNSSWVFQVWDTGVGIAPEHMDRIYEEFYQIDNPGRIRSRGLGLGLSIVRRAADLLAYKLGCVSRVGQGTRFELELPRVLFREDRGGEYAGAGAQSEDISAKVGRSAGGAQAAIALTHAFRGKSFVVLEDDPLVAEALCSWLEALGCAVSTFTRGEDALQSAHADSADYFVADMQLEGQMTGQATLEEIQKRRTDALCAVVVTGNTRSDFVVGVSEGPWPVLFKPVTGQQILAALQESHSEISS